MKALAPQRLVLAFFLVFTLGAVGKLGDWAHLRLGGGAVGPGGLVAGGWSTDQQASALKGVARNATSFAAGTGFANQPLADQSPSQLAAFADAVYLEKRAAIDARETPDARAIGFLDTRHRELRIAIEGARPRGPFEALAAEEAMALRHLVAAVVAIAPAAALESILDAVIRVPAGAIAIAPWTVLLVGLPLAVIASIVGGGLCRMTLLEAGQGQRLTAFEGAGFARRAVARLALVPVLPAVTLLALLGVIVVLGGLLRVPGLDLVGGFLYGVTLLLAFLVVTGGGAAILGFPLAVASVAAGDADAIDANVRSTAYLFRRPMRWFLAHLTGALSIALGLLVVGLVAMGALGLASWGVGVLGGTTALNAAGAGGIAAPAAPQLPVAGMTGRVAATFIDLWDGIFLGLVAAYVASACAEVAGRAYLVLRYDCDGQDPSTIDAIPLGRPGPG